MLEVFVLFLCFCYLIDKLVNRKKWKMLSKVPGQIPLPIIGNLKDILFQSRNKKINPITYFFLHRQGVNLLFRKEKLNVLWVGRHPMVVLTAPESVEAIFSSNSALEKGDFYRFLKPWLAEGLVMSTGDKWRKHRKMLTPSFHFRILDNFLPVMNEQAAVLTSKIKEASATKDWIDCFDAYSKCTLDIICETAMGIKIGAQEGDSTYTKMIHDVAYQAGVRSSRPWLRWDLIYYRTEGGRAFRKAVEYLHGVTDRVISEKLVERNNVKKTEGSDKVESEFGEKKRLAFLDLLLESEMSTQEMREQVDTFMFAGHDTTATALSWMTYMIGLHPDVQEKLLQEIDSIFGDDIDRHVTQDDLKKLKYLDLVMKESQRVYPSVPGITRTLDKDTDICGHMIPKGTECFMSIYAVHRHPDHYSDPEIFDPERFTPENSVGRHPYAFVPFSAGPRNCIGQKFAGMEQRIVACHVLRRFKILSLDKRDQIELVPQLVLKTGEPIRTRFIPRE